MAAGEVLISVPSKRAEQPDSRRTLETLAMMVRNWGAAVIVVLLAGAASAAPAPFTVKVVEGTHPPGELAEPIQKLLADRVIQLVDSKGELTLELWFRKTVPAKATEAQVKNGLTYRELTESTVLGAVRVAKQFTDFRKQKIKPGVYTLRLGFQPMDGDHMGTAPFSEFCLLSPAAEDKSADTMETKALQEMSTKTTSNHPGVMLLFPPKGAAEPKIVDKGEGNWAVEFKQDVDAGGMKASLGISLTVSGASPAA
jgi:hypothetical protein